MLELGSEDSWPDLVRLLLERESRQLSSYEAKRKRIDLLMTENVLMRLDPPINPFADERTKQIAKLDALVAKEPVVAWHCTRLLPHEKDSILKTGLRCHSRALFCKRISEAIEHGVLSQSQGDALLTRGQVGEMGRTNLLHVILARDTLQDEGAVTDLLRNWGGEAIYNSAGRNRRGATSILAGIGEPAIIEVYFPISWLSGPSVSIGERIVNRHLDRLGVATEHGWRCDGKLKLDLPPSTITRVIQPTHSMFEALTAQTSWTCPLY